MMELLLFWAAMALLALGFSWNDRRRARRRQGAEVRPVPEGRPPATEGRRFGSERTLILAALALVVFSVLYAPHVVEVQGGRFSLGYGWIFNPPKLRGTVQGTLDMGRLFAEWVGIGALVAAVWLLRRMGSRKSG